MTPAIFINCKEVPFIEKIFSRDKLFETRTKNVLRKFTGMRVLLVETGNGVPMVRGSVICGHPSAITDARAWDTARSTTQVPVGSRYDWTKDTRIKWLTPMFSPLMCEPFPLPADAVRHGRTWAEYRGRYDFTPDFEGFDSDPRFFS